jgi:hypothetical protein
MQQAFDADVLVNVRPMHPLPGPYQAKVRSLRGGGFGQSPGPRQWDADNPSVGKVGDDLVFSDLHRYDTIDHTPR